MTEFQKKIEAVENAVKDLIKLDIPEPVQMEDVGNVIAAMIVLQGYSKILAGRYVDENNLMEKAKTTVVSEMPDSVN